MAALEALLDGILARWSIPPARGDRPFRHGAGPQGRSGAEVRLAPAGARRAGGLGRRRRGAGAGWEAFRAAAAAAGYAAPGGDWAAVLAAFRLRFRPWARAAAPERPTSAALRALAAALTGAGVPA